MNRHTTAAGASLISLEAMAFVGTLYINNHMPRRSDLTRLTTGGPRYTFLSWTSGSFLHFETRINFDLTLQH